MQYYLAYGDRVTVTGRKSYKGKYLDCIGTVCNCSPLAGGKVGVTLDGLSNPASSHGYFWFARHELTLLPLEEEKHDTTDKEENSMLIPGYVVARVVFLDDKSTQKNEHPYAYALYPDAAREGDLVCEGDTVVVMTGHHGPALAEVVRIDLDAAPDVVKADREVICKVYDQPYLDRRKSVERIQKLKEEMSARVKKLQELAVFEMLAKEDEDLRAMLDEFKLLTKEG